MKHTIEKENWMIANHRGVVSYTNSTRLNNLLLSRLNDATDLIIDWDKQNKIYSVKEVKIALVQLWGLEKPKDETPVIKEGDIANIELISSTTNEEISDPVTFFDFAKLYLKNMESEGKYLVSTERSKIKHFQEYLLTLEVAKWKSEKSETSLPELANIDIAFSNITVSLVKSYKAYLAKTLKVGKDIEKQRSVKERTIINHLIIIRTIYNQGILNKKASRDDYPFGKGKISIKIPESLKIGLCEADIRKLTDFSASIPAITDYSFIRERKVHNGLDQRLKALRKKDPNAELNDADKGRLAQINLWRDQYLKHALNVWMVSFYFAGMRLSDTLLLKWSDFRNGRLYYTMGKNRKPGSLKVPEKLLAILEEYRCDEQKHDLIFPELKVLDSLDDQYKVQQKIANADSRLNGALKIVGTRTNINIPINPHGSRHAFGNIAGDSISVQQLQKLYRHTSITTTVAYQAAFMHKNADEALDSVINF